MLILQKSWGDKSAGNVLAYKHDSLSLIPTTHEKSQAWLHLLSQSWGMKPSRSLEVTGQPDQLQWQAPDPRDPISKHAVDSS